MAAACAHKHASLVTGHAYTLLGTIQLKGGPKLIKLRNPWGKEKYNGPFRDDDPKWNTHGWRQQAGLVKANDGIFHIPLKDFKKAFTFYSVLMYQNWHTTSKKIQGTGKKFKTSITSSCAQRVVLTADYQNARQVPAGCKKPNVFYNFYIYGMGPNKPRVVSSQTGYGAHSFDISAGKTHRVLLINWRDAKAHTDVVFHAYGAKCNVKWG